MNYIRIISLSIVITLILCSFTSGTNLTSPQPRKKIIGYYAAWAAYGGFTPKSINVGKLTHINYAFAAIGSDLKITLGFPDIDPKNFKLLNDLKKNNSNLKTLISVGGWTWSGRFSDAALTEKSREVFADSCVDFITKYGFDGIDLDWEYPVSGGLADNTYRPEDKQNFTLLLKTIRQKLDAQESKDKKEYLLSIAGGASAFYFKNIELSKLHPYLDYASLMTYDIHGSWDQYTDFHAPLYSNKDVSPQYKWSVDSSVDLWLKAGFPKDKLVVGIPFYGHIYTSVKNNKNGLYQPYQSTNSISFRDITANHLLKPGYVRYFHSESKIPWLFNGSTFINYEDAESIKIKADYIKTKELAGAMIWELSLDSNQLLLNALYDGIQK
ncbi:glycoside hydrolase family 18 protein [Sinanaerobacter chloroacetimidivorans]|uniref:chitinase n=1 Tax=Sinanaerobacter chloroacetimidivorans TaxID=2818044 RepID=A0A8J7W462_9FIRM|nr:glycoside hydrolase family 18 protein [Sinanaerobacter chloroacetimidivorans]MBR0600612.1 glycoside hydrolase family 18 protein [Sinanaerobacter chloroacetimidivorans]